MQLPTTKLLCLFTMLIALDCLSAQQDVGKNKTIVIAHRGASGYLPEHTSESAALAYGMGADYIEQDVVLTKDDVPVVIHDIQLDAITDVAKRFPDRARPDSRFYVVDFTLQEIKQLRVNQRIDLKTGRLDFENRLSFVKTGFEISTLAEAIEMIQALNVSTGRNVGIYPEIKKPSWHQKHGKDISRHVLDVLNKYGYKKRSDPIFLQCFDPAELKRIRHELNCKLKLIQLIGNDDWDEAETSYSRMVTERGVQEVTKYADGIGPWLPHLLTTNGNSKKPAKLIEYARRSNLSVHPFTFRADDLPDYVSSFDELLEIFVNQVRIDGLFTDHPDVVLKWLQKSSAR